MAPTNSSQLRLLRNEDYVFYSEFSPSFQEDEEECTCCFQASVIVLVIGSVILTFMIMELAKLLLHSCLNRIESKAEST